MTRSLVVVALLALPAGAFAQNNSPVVVGPPVIGGREITGPPISNGSSSLYPVQTPVPSPFSVGGGSLSAPPQILVPSGGWGGINYPRPVYRVIVPPEADPVPAAQPATVVLVGDGTATLAVQLPAPAQLWVDRKKIDGQPVTELTLTSPALKAGESHTFEVKGRWAARGKTFEVTRSVTVAVGVRSKLTVVSGTEVKE